ncbi:glutaredoxin family protein [Aliiglaciecola lipolytica]|uniref:Glutaredoxin 2 n=1 Tax=Aliiglaciecola lipolytica E3 TaxID=1127673 RepID=K6YDW6_9ALTE|nr:glutaredoxin family protein [Aliiglaciecola lipolytica]GAC14803.1 glutaredoxin 2 [Aliiglaciecola lipolytica E3]
MQLYFYTGKQCHLCELAQALLDQVKSSYDLNVTKVDVKSDTQLFHLYGARIPVLKRMDTQAELGWPFDLTQLQEFLD